MSNPKNKFSQIYDKYIEKVYRFVFLKVNSQEIAEDLTSEAFLRTWEVFRKDEEKIRNVSAFLYKTARNLVIDHYRQKGRVTIFTTEDVPIIDENQDLKADAEISSDMDLIRKHLAGLKDDYQNVIILRYLDDLPISEIARIMDRTNGATRTLLHRAMNALREKIEEV
ncbi:MAG: sigma-70 family RNA polymerase sigma factor [Candidatus Nealsonbacteria bacterium]|nr:sigma-70 family RNA polymerase sigma factor [Candidatus Nealsonbacteria bacterium]